MRATRVPPKLEPAKTTAGLPVGPRELVIVGVAFTFAVLVFFTGLPFFVRVGMAVALVGLAATYALARVEGRYTIEEYWFHRLGFSSRVRRRIKGGKGIVSRTGRLERGVSTPRPAQQQRRRVAWFTIPAESVPANHVMLVNAIGVALLSAFLAWLGGGGLAELMQLRANVLYLR